jgi:predicted flavoprotein YhiN
MNENITNIPEYADICIVGAGASGLTAAISAKREDPSLSVVLLEKNAEPGRKIKATGNGRCNLGNTNCDDFEAVRDFFTSLGVMLRVEEEGRVYPYSQEASSVSGALISEAEQLGCMILCSSCVREITKPGDDFKIKYVLEKRSKIPGGKKGLKNRAGKSAASDPEMTMSAARVIIAAGGKAGPQYGTCGDGTRFAKQLGHRITRLVPGLTAVETAEETYMMAGSRAVCEIGLEKDGALIRKERGEIQITDYGISGIAVFNMTMYMDIPEGMDIKEGFSHYAITVDFLPDIDDAASMLDKIASCSPEGTNPLYTIVKKKIADWMYDRAGGDTEVMAKLLKRSVFHPSDLRGWKYCQVTRGGVAAEDIDMDTMESVKMGGLYFAGEVADRQGLCGGYNLENAWTTGMTAGRSAARSLKGD